MGTGVTRYQYINHISRYIVATRHIVMRAVKWAAIPERHILSQLGFGGRAERKHQIISIIHILYFNSKGKQKSD